MTNETVLVYLFSLLRLTEKKLIKQQTTRKLNFIQELFKKIGACVFLAPVLFWRKICNETYSNYIARKKFKTEYAYFEGPCFFLTFWRENWKFLKRCYQSNIRKKNWHFNSRNYFSPANFKGNSFNKSFLFKKSISIAGCKPNNLSCDFSDILEVK